MADRMEGDGLIFSVEVASPELLQSLLAKPQQWPQTVESPAGENISQRTLLSAPHQGETASRYVALRNYREYLGGEKQHTLPACGENLCGTEEFVGHQDSRTEDSSHGCPEYEKRFRPRHRNNNSGRKPHKCSVCWKNFTFRAELARHHRIHTGEKPYGCSQCGRSFRQRVHLVKHQMIHTGEKPYRCLECGKSFSWGENLWRHRRVHTREKLYKCSHCSNCFSQSGDLKIHQRIHTGEKPYKCPECDKSFRRRQHLMGHQRTHSRE
nr:zinc finger protein 239-like [Zootoca vivipara]